MDKNRDLCSGWEGGMPECYVAQERGTQNGSLCFKYFLNDPQGNILNTSVLSRCRWVHYE